MSFSAGNKTCGICSGSVGTGVGQAIFTAECSHSFHFPCIANYISLSNRNCPVCRAQWNHLPFNQQHNLNYNNGPFYNQQHNFNYNSSPSYNPFQSITRFFNQFYQFGEPPQFCDDDPLPADPTSSPVGPVGSQKVKIKAVPERPAVAASESVSLFSVLVGLKAPPLSNDAPTSQRASIDIVTVLDVSGSMTGIKLDLVKGAVHFVIDNLGVSDRLSVVSFSDRAARLLPLRRMTESGREDAKKAVNQLIANGGTNIVEGLKKGARVLGERRHRNAVSSIIFLSDGNDTCNCTSPFQFNGYGFNQGFSHSRNVPDYLHLLPASIYPKNRGLEPGQLETIPVHSFGFGSDHDPITMHAISDASGGTFSFIESYAMVQDAFAGCIGGLLSVVTQDLRLKVRSASHGVEIKSIPSGRYASGISNQGSEGLVSVGDLYADEDKEFLINLTVPILPNIGEGEESNEKKTSLLDITCCYKDVASKEIVQIEGDLVEIRRPKSVSPQDMLINVEVDRQKNRVHVAECIKQAQQMAETGNFGGATDLLAKERSVLLGSASGQAGDGLCRWLGAEMKETERLMGSSQMYQQSGRAYALAGMSSHATQRATTRGNAVLGGAMGGGFGFGCAAPPGSAALGSSFGGPPDGGFGGYATPNMVNMVSKSQQVNKTGQDNIPMEE